ncbi:hypothetical protein JQC91_17470 [Jannaschia sp. Os4]|uniref:G8 domain-containing protein n=1 Tax=Jannaschia sp. Os4 TaxID=2807617 RepID=UPI00193A036B|nr:G8 domain-containing protein [Jannaschia sp. Os4]MBM2578100.1 hypothetical protein [Jannaschia sp. Os4]
MMKIEDNDAFLMARGPGSRIEIHAADAAKASWTQLDGTVAAGATTITLADATGWEVGDRIAIASTGFEMDEAEARVVTGLGADGRTLTLDAALDFSHFGEIEAHDAGGRVDRIDMRAEVALLSRNVTIQGDADSVEDGHGGHTMVMGGAEMHVDGAELTRMGQAGELGRYPLHWHMLGDASGQYVTNSSIHDTYNKGLTIHGTQNAWVEGNAVVETVGHGFYFEDGSEFGNVLRGNLGMNTRATESVAAGPIGSDHTAVSTYWVTNPNNHLVDNHAAGSDVAGFWVLSQTQVEGLSAEAGIYDGYRPNAQAPGQWSGNASHTNGDDGFFIGGQFVESTGARTSFDEHLQQAFLIDAFTTFKNGGFGIWTRNAGGEWTDLAIADSKKGARMWGANEIEEAVIVGRSGNYERYGFDSYHGWELYDMASVMSDVHFAGFDGADDAAIANHSGFGRNTNNAVQGLTFGDDVDRPFATRTWTSFLDGLVDADGALMGGLHDLDGSLTGRAGAVITPGMIDSRPGVEMDVLAYAFDGVPAAGFNWTEGAEWDAEGSYWLNPAGAMIGKQTFATSGDAAERVDFEITRTDNGASILYGAATQGRNGWAQLNVDGAMEGEYVVGYPEGPPPTDVEMQIRDLAFGTDVTYRLTDAPDGTVVQGADRVADRAALDAADGSAWFREANGDLMLRMVADTYSSRPYEAIDDLPGVGDDVYRDFVRLIFAPGPGDADRPDSPPSLAPDDFRPDPAPAPLPDRAESTSRTVDDVAGLARWSDETVWGDGAPGAGDVVVIGAGQRVVLDADATVEGILVAGEGAALIVEDEAGSAIDLVADWVLVEDGGLFQAGTEADPLDTDFTLTLTGDDPDHDLDVAALRAGDVAGAVFAGAGGGGGPAPAPEAGTPGGAAIGAAGRATVAQDGPDQWHRVAFDAPLADAVVVMGPVGANGGHPAVTRIRDVTEAGFEFQIDEWDYKDGRHVEETVGWLAVTEGTHTLSTGQTVVAGRAEVGTDVSTQAFGTALEDAVVLSEVASSEDAGAVALRTRDVTRDGFSLRLQEEEAADGVHADEAVDWIAVEAGGGAGLAAGRTGDVLTHRRDTFAFGDGFEAPPVLLADLQTTDGGDTAALRYDALTPAGVDLFVQEERSRDAEIGHTTEVAGWLALEEGLLLAA